MMLLKPVLFTFHKKNLVVSDSIEGARNDSLKGGQKASSKSRLFKRWTLIISPEKSAQPREPTIMATTVKHS